MNLGETSMFNAKAAMMGSLKRIGMSIYAMAVSAKNALQTFRIQQDKFPILPSMGEIISKNHLKWLELCQLNSS